MIRYKGEMNSMGCYSSLSKDEGEIKPTEDLSGVYLNQKQIKKVNQARDSILQQLEPMAKSHDPGSNPNYLTFDQSEIYRGLFNGKNVNLNKYGVETLTRLKKNWQSGR